MGKHVVVIGGSAAGLAATLAAKREKPETSITVFDEDPYIPYRRPNIAGIVEGVFRNVKDLQVFLRDLRRLGVKVVNNAKVIEINHNSKVLKVKLPTGVEKVNYDTLVLATGAEAIKQDVEGVHLKGVFTFRKLSDALKISKYVEGKNVKKAVVIGASFVALLLTEALVKRGIKVGIVVRSRVLRKMLEPVQSIIVEKYLAKEGVEVYKGVVLEKILGKKYVEKTVLSSGEAVKTDIVVFAIGAKPSIKLAEKIGCKIVGNILDVDKHMETSISGIYAAGDCTYSWDLITESKTYIPNATVASIYGKVAGLNALGLNIEAPSVLRIQFEKILGLNIVTCGYTGEEAKKIGLNAKTVDLTEELKKVFKLWKNRILNIMVTVNGKGKVIGVEAIGLNNITSLTYPYIYAIKEKMVLNEISKLHPPIPSMVKTITLPATIFTSQYLRKTLDLGKTYR